MIPRPFVALWPALFSKCPPSVHLTCFISYLFLSFLSFSLCYVIFLFRFMSVVCSGMQWYAVVWGGMRRYWVVRVGIRWFAVVWGELEKFAMERQTNTQACL
jgi:hypothetical protein